jgi:DNA polymerase/3'-5' exonuclease PolX
MNNDFIAACLEDHARSLDPATNLYRIWAYRHAAVMIQRLHVKMTELLRVGGRRALAALPGIGEHLAFTIETLIHTGEVVPWAERRSVA